MPRSKNLQLVGKLAVETASGAFLGDTRIRLLEQIAAHGSITRAAKAVPLSYKAAWDAVDAMNNVSEQPLVERSVGGQRGGGTQLTDYGRRVVAFYRAMEREYQHGLDQMSRHLRASTAAGGGFLPAAGGGSLPAADGGSLPAAGRIAAEVGHFRSLLHRLSMRSSARNQFAGRVSSLREGEVNFEVGLRLDPGTELVAIITRASAEHLGLAIGKEVHAFVKAQTVILLTARVRTSARNHLWGEIARIHDDGLNAEVSLTLPGGRSVTAIVTQESVRALELAPGLRACAVIKASDVILATFE